MRSPYGSNCITVIKACQQVFVCYSISALRTTAIAGVLLAIFIAGYHGQQKQSHPGNVQQTAQRAPKQSASMQTKPAPVEQKDSRSQKTINYLKRAFGPEYLAAWVLVLAAGIGLFATFRTLDTIRKQTDATVRSADAALLNATALMDSERAWIIIRKATPPPLVAQAPVGPLMTMWFGLGFINCGKTAARVTNVQLRFHTVKKLTDLPAIPDYTKGTFDAELFVGRPLPPKDKMQISTMLEEGYLSDNRSLRLGEGN